MVIVVDNSMVLPLFIPDEDSSRAEEVMEKVASGVELLVPRLWVLEFGNGLLVSVRRGRLEPQQALLAHQAARRLPITILDFPDVPDLSNLHKLAEAHGLSFYDAAYLALAMNRGGQVATQDKALSSAAGREGILYGGA